MKLRYRIFVIAILLFVLSGLQFNNPVNGQPAVIKECLCPDVMDPHIDANGRAYSNGCQCRCRSSVPNTCVRTGDI